MGFGAGAGTDGTGSGDGAESNETALTESAHGEVAKVFSCTGRTMTPPVGSVLFVGVSAGGTTIERVFPDFVPYLLVTVALLLAFTVVPALSPGLPGAMNLL